MSLQVRGRILLRTLAYAEERFGADVLQQALGKCSKGVSAALQNAVVEGGWYPVVWLTSLEKGLVEATGAPEAMFELGHDTAPRMVREATRVALHLNSMWSVINKMPKMVGDAFDGALLDVDVHESGMSAELRYSGCPGFTQLTWEMIEGGIVGILEAAGAHGILVEPTAGGGDGDDHFTFIVRYQGRPSLPPRPG